MSARNMCRTRPPHNHVHIFTIEYNKIFFFLFFSHQYTQARWCRVHTDQLVHKKEGRKQLWTKMKKITTAKHNHTQYRDIHFTTTAVAGRQPERERRLALAKKLKKSGKEKKKIFNCEEKIFIKKRFFGKLKKKNRQFREFSLCVHILVEENKSDFFCIRIKKENFRGTWKSRCKWRKKCNKNLFSVFDMCKTTWKCNW